MTKDKNSSDDNSPANFDEDGNRCITPEMEKTKWKKGQSGNPAGRKKGSRNLTTIMREMINEVITQPDITAPPDENGKRPMVKRSMGDLIVAKLMHMAFHEGDKEAMKMLQDRMEGTLAQQMVIDQTNRNETLDITDDEIMEAMKEKYRRQAKMAEDRERHKKESKNDDK